MTSPLVPETEVYISGSAVLVRGKARVDLDRDMADVISPSQSIKVILTPTAMCNGLAVTEKRSSGFKVEELASGNSNATFDWLVIARKAVSMDNREAEEMPTVIPRAIEPPAPVEGS